MAADLKLTDEGHNSLDIGETVRETKIARPLMKSIGILVHGDNHFIVRGPLPSRACAIALVRHWSIIRIGAQTPPHLDRWRISAKEFRENLEWAVRVPGDGETTAAVAQLLAELTSRGIAIRDAGSSTW
jgi:hypothetical protein